MTTVLTIKSAPDNDTPVPVITVEEPDPETEEEITYDPNKDIANPNTKVPFNIATGIITITSAAVMFISRRRSSHNDK